MKNFAMFMDVFWKAHPRAARWSQRLAMTFAALTISAVIGTVLWVVPPFVTAGRLQKVYNRVEPGMLAAHVNALMKHPGRIRTSGWCALWDWEKLADADSNRIVSSTMYTVPTFFLPISFEFQYDKDGKVVGKHRYD